MRRLFLLAFVWGWSFLFIRVVVEGAPPSFLAAGRISIGAAVGTTACYGFSFCWARRTLGTVPPIVIATGQLLVGTVIAVPLAAVAVARDGLDLTPVRLLCLFLLGAFGTGIAYLLNYRVIAELGATSASLVTFLIPLVGVTVGIAVLDEPFSLRLLAGAAVVLAGVGMVQWRVLRPLPEPVA